MQVSECILSDEPLAVTSPFFPGIILSKKPPKTLGKQIRLLKTTMAENNGESTPGEPGRRNKKRALTFGGAHAQKSCDASCGYVYKRIGKPTRLVASVSFWLPVKKPPQKATNSHTKNTHVDMGFLQEAFVLKMIFPTSVILIHFIYSCLGLKMSNLPSCPVAPLFFILFFWGEGFRFLATQRN